LSTASTRSSIENEKSRLTVVKLGGSLLDLNGLVDTLIAAIGELAFPVVVTGGGPSADLVRHWDNCGRVSQNEAHKIGIAAMSFNGLLLSRTDGRLAFVGSRSEAVEAAARGQIPVLDVMMAIAVEQAERPDSPEIPESWDVTSDSIAAWLAEVWHAELWLLKSVPPGAAPALHVDKWFGRASQALPGLIWVNLRASESGPVRLTLPLAAAAN